jgi:hypothetical protein
MQLVSFFDKFAGTHQLFAGRRTGWIEHGIGLNAVSLQLVSFLTSLPVRTNCFPVGVPVGQSTG